MPFLKRLGSRIYVLPVLMTGLITSLFFFNRRQIHREYYISVWAARPKLCKVPTLDQLKKKPQYWGGVVDVYHTKVANDDELLKLIRKANKNLYFPKIERKVVANVGLKKRLYVSPSPYSSIQISISTPNQEEITKYYQSQNTSGRFFDLASECTRLLKIEIAGKVAIQNNLLHDTNNASMKMPDQSVGHFRTIRFVPKDVVLCANPGLHFLTLPSKGTSSRLDHPIRTIQRESDLIFIQISDK